MPDLEKKIGIFSNIILNEAEQKKNKIAEEIKKRRDSAVKERETEFLSDAYEDIQKAVSKYSKENNERILKVEMDLKKELIKKRERIIEDIFQKVGTMLENFCLSPEYKDWLSENVKYAVSQAGEGKIKISKRDSRYKDDIISAAPGCIVETDEDDSLIGGVTVVSNNISADCTIKEKLNEQRRGFLKTSGLSIRV